MVVTCPKCSTSYEFDDTLIGHKGTVVRCTQCSHMFKIFADEGEEVLRKAGWMVRKKDGKVFGIDRFATVQKWIREGKIKADDELSRTGKSWKKLGEIVELQKLFITLEAQGGVASTAVSRDEKPAVEPRLSIQADDALMDTVAAGSPAAQVPEKPAPAPSATARPPRTEEPPAGRELSYDAPEAEEGTVKGPLARSVVPPADEELEAVDETDRLLMPGYRPGRWKRVVLVIVLLVLAGLGVLGYFQRDLIMDWVSSMQDPASKGDREKSLERAHEYFLLDTGSYFDQAEKILRDLLARDDQDPEARAALAELLAVRAQYARDRKEILEQSSDLEDAGTLAREAHKLAKLAVLAQPQSVEANRALADSLRLTGDLEGARESINKALDLAPRDPETLYVAVLIDREEGLELDEAIEDLQRIVKRSNSLIRVRFRLALMQALAGNEDEARAQAEAILELNPDHVMAHNLMDAIDSGGLPAPPAEASEPVAESAEDDADEEPETAGQEAQEEEGPADVPATTAETGPARGGQGGGEVSHGVPAGKSYDFYIGKAVKLQHAGDCSEAFDYFQKAIQERPTSTEAYSGTAYCHMALGQYGPAVSAFKKALKTNKNYGPALIGLAQAYEKRGDDKSAVTYYEKYLDVFSSGGQAALARNKIKQLSASEEEDESSSPSPSTEGGADSGSSSSVEPPGTGTEVEIKGSVGQPSSDNPTTAGDPYD